MASTVTAATLKVTVSENIRLKGKQLGGSNTISIASINEISTRIMTVRE